MAPPHTGQASATPRRRGRGIKYTALGCSCRAFHAAFSVGGRSSRRLQPRRLARRGLALGGGAATLGGRSLGLGLGSGLALRAWVGLGLGSGLG
eukprot:scaffold8255_cov58-Phaeocystis_antarctica.AAC.1